MTWTDHEGRAAPAPEPPAVGSHYAAIGDFQGGHYERNAFARGTAQEVSVLADVLRLEPGIRLLDVGCGTGRHARALVERGVEAIGVDLSAGLLAHAEDRLPGRWLRGDARALALPSGSFDAVMSVCQGGFSISRDGDGLALAEMARVARRGALLAVTAYSLEFAQRFLAPGDAIDDERGLVHTRADVRGPDGHERTFDLWTQCYTPDGMEAMGRAAGLRLEEISSAVPGYYTQTRPVARGPEFLCTFSKR